MINTASNKRKSILHLICGLPGSGKSTLSKKIESSEDAIRFSPDEWIKEIWGKDKSETEGNKYRDQIEEFQWKIAKQILKSGIDVIIEWGTWSKSEREKLRDEAHKIGSEVKLYYLDVPREVLKSRILERNKNLGEHEFLMSKESLDLELDKSFDMLQPPDQDELETYDYLG